MDATTGLGGVTGLGGGVGGDAGLELAGELPNRTVPVLAEDPPILTVPEDGAERPTKTVPGLRGGEKRWFGRSLARARTYRYMVVP